MPDTTTEIPDTTSISVPVTRPPYDAHAVAERVLADLTGPAGQRRICRRGHSYRQPDRRTGQWSEVPHHEIRDRLTYAGTLQHWRMLAPRLDAAQDILDQHLDADPIETRPHLDIDAITTPDRPNGPPGNWPTHLTGTPTPTSGLPKYWVARHCYAASGRAIIVHHGQLRKWDGNAWVQMPGGIDEFVLHNMKRLAPDLVGHINGAHTSEALDLLRVNDINPTGPAQVAAYDLRRERQQLTQQQHANIAGQLAGRETPYGAGQEWI